LAPLSAIGFFGLAMMLATSGRLRRFFAGLAVTGVLVGLLLWVGPLSFRSFVLIRILLPFDDLLSQTLPNSFNKLVLAVYLDMTNHWERPISLTRFPFLFRETQVILGYLELAVAVVGGLLAAIPRPRPTRPAVLTNA
jgi:hypothetical protein